MSTGSSKLLELQAKFQLQLEQLKSDCLAKITIPHGVTIHSGEPVSLPQFTLGNLCQTIEQCKKFSSPHIYLKI